MADIKHWVLRVGNGKNFIASSNKRVWGIKDKYKTFIKEVKPNDILWFKSNKEIIAVATFVKKVNRIIGPLIPLTETNEELGWTGDGDWKIEIHYDNLYNLINRDIKPIITGQCTIRRYSYHDEGINLLCEYPYIIKYGTSVTSMK
jgi:hypothetical protein